jgi:ATP-dependent RNA helicase SUPV3L1/SUV3
VASRLGVKADQLAAVLAALGFRLLPSVALEAGQYGPPAPTMVEARRQEQRRPPRGPRAEREERRPRAQAAAAAPLAEAPAFIPPQIAAAAAQAAAAPKREGDHGRLQERRPPREAGRPRGPEAATDRPLPAGRRDRPRPDAAPQGSEAGRTGDAPRSDRPSPAEASRGDRPRQGDAPRGDRPFPPRGDRGPRPDRGERSWRDPKPSQGADPDSPFAVLAALLKK